MFNGVIFTLFSNSYKLLKMYKIIIRHNIMQHTIIISLFKYLHPYYIRLISTGRALNASHICIHVSLDTVIRYITMTNRNVYHRAFDEQYIIIL